MALTADEIIKIIKESKQMGFNHVRVEGVELISGPEKEVVDHGPVPDMKAEDIINPLSVFEEPDEKEVLYWSSPYYDELMSQKAAKAAMKENE
jgi:hypothetical protein